MLIKLLINLNLINLNVYGENNTFSVCIIPRTVFLSDIVRDAADIKKGLVCFLPAVVRFHACVSNKCPECKRPGQAPASCACVTQGNFIYFLGSHNNVLLLIQCRQFMAVNMARKSLSLYVRIITGSYTKPTTFY